MVRIYWSKAALLAELPEGVFLVVIRHKSHGYMVDRKHLKGGFNPCFVLLPFCSKSDYLSLSKEVEFNGKKSYLVELVVVVGHCSGYGAELGFCC